VTATGREREDQTHRDRARQAKEGGVSNNLHARDAKKKKEKKAEKTKKGKAWEKEDGGERVRQTNQIHET
jgi:hypothetical protein